MTTRKADDAGLRKTVNLAYLEAIQKAPVQWDTLDLAFAVQIAVSLVLAERERMSQPPYPYFWRSVVQREKTRCHRLMNKINKELLPNLRSWKQRFKSTRGTVPGIAKRIADLERQVAEYEGMDRAVDVYRERAVELERQVKEAEAALTRWRAMPLSKRLAVEMERADDCEKRAESAERDRDEARGENAALSITIDESAECAADMFAIFKGVISEDEAAREAAFKRIREHVEHVEKCRKGSCAWELGESERNAIYQRDEARRALAEHHKVALDPGELCLVCFPAPAESADERTYHNPADPCVDPDTCPAQQDFESAETEADRCQREIKEQNDYPNR